MSIINIADSITINRKRVAGVQMSRNEIIRVSETPTRRPWRFTVSATGSLVYSQARAILEQIDVLDRVTPEIIQMNTNPRLAWLFRYQGELIDAQLSAIRVSSFTGNQLVLYNMPTVSPTTVVFAAGDFLQIQGSPYPYTVTQTYTGSNINASNFITVTTHRPNIISTSVSNQPLNFGSAVQFNMLCQNSPTYTLVPGAAHYVGNELINNARVEWDSAFELVEFTGTA